MVVAIDDSWASVARCSELPRAGRGSSLALALVAMRRLICDERGATAIEYSLIAAGIAMAVIATVMSLGSTVKSTFYDRLISVM